MDDVPMSSETSYYVSDLSGELAGVEALSFYIRGHWGIESVPRGHARSDRKEVLG